MMTYICLCTTIACLAFLFIHRKNVLERLNTYTGQATLSKQICGASIFCLVMISLIPFLSYQYPRLALVIMLVLLAIYAGIIYGMHIHRLKPVSIFLEWLASHNMYLLGMLITMLICGVFAAILSSYSFPLAEGWYSLYAKLINQGQLPYKDFELLFTPFYSYLVALITRIFGYEISVLRIVGVILFILLSALHYAIYERIFRSPAIASIAATAATIYQQSEVVQVFYDYIRFFDFFAYLGTVLLIVYVRRYLEIKASDEVMHTQRPIWIWMLACGISLSLSALIRQNSGAIIVIYVIILMIGMIIVFSKKKSLLGGLLAYMIGALGVLGICILFMHKTGMLPLFLQGTTSSAIASKGGIGTVLFAWIPKALLSGGQNSVFIGIILVFFIVNYYLTKRYQTDHEIVKHQWLTWVLFSAFTFLICILASIIPSFAHSFGAFNLRTEMPFIAFFVTLELFIMELVLVVQNKKVDKESLLIHVPLFVTLGMAFAINYGSGTSASLSQGQTALNLGLIIALTLYLTRHQYCKPVELVIFFIITWMTVSNMVYKYESPYSWWGLNEDSVFEDDYELDIPVVQGIKVSQETYDGITGIYNDIMSHSAQGDSIFVFPHAPIFYVMTDRYADTYTYIQWFDVASDQAVINDIDVLEDSMPKVIVHIHVPEGVMESHEDLFRSGAESGLRVMDRKLKELESSGNYERIDDYMIQEYKVDVYSRKEEKME